MRIEIRSFRPVLSATAALLIAGAAVAQAPTTPPAPAAGETAPGATGAPTAATGTEPVELNLEEAKKKGEEALKASNYEEALAVYTGLLRAAAANQQTSPEAAGAAQVIGLVGRGRALTGLKEYDAAMDDFNNILNNFDAAHGPTLVARGQLRLEKNDPELAMADFSAVLKQERNNPEAQLGLGKSLVTLGRGDEAVSPLTHAIATDPQNAEAFRFRGSAYGSAFKLAKAVEDLQQSVSLNPEESEAYLMLGLVFLRAEDYQHAAEQFAKAIEHYKPKPGLEDVPYAQGYFQLAMAYVELGKVTKDEVGQKAAYEAAVNTYNKLLQQLGDKNPMPLYVQLRATALYGRGVAERMLGEYGTAIKSLSQALELAPETGEAYFRRGICFHKIGEDRMAISDFERAAHMSDDDPRCNLWAGITYAKLGEYHKALKAYGDAIAVSDRYTPAYVNRALAYWALGEYDKAIADVNEAIRLDPTNAEHYYKRGRAFERLGDNQKASESYATTLEFNSKHADAYRHMATVQQSLGRSELAAQYSQKADELEAAKAKKQ